MTRLFCLLLCLIWCWFAVFSIFNSKQLLQEMEEIEMQARAAFLQCEALKHKQVYIFERMLGFTNSFRIDEVMCSYYADFFEGRQMANGRVFRQDSHSIAHKTLRIGTVVFLEYQGRKSWGVVEDRGPHIVGREFDFSKKIAQELGMVEKGVAKVKVAYREKE